MKLVLLFLITFLVFSGFALLLIYCRRRVNRTRHGLTGMCHTTGGSMCGSCQSSLENKQCTHPS